MTITIKGSPITKKNSQQILTNRATGRPFIMPSKQYKAYEQSALKQIGARGSPIDYSCNVACVYFMPTRRRVDLANLIEATTDILVKAKILTDDNCGIVSSHDGSCVCYDKENPRAVIYITPRESANA